MTLRPAALVAHVALTGGLGLLLCVYGPAREALRVEVDLRASGGTRVELFVNDLVRPPLGQPLVPGERKRYVFEGIAEDITMLRLDPTNEAKATVEIFSLGVYGSRGRVAEFDPQALAAWATSGVGIMGYDGTVLRIRALDADPIITARTRISAGQVAGWTRWLPRVNAPDVTWWLAAAGVVLFLSAGCFDPARRLHLPMGVTAMASALLVVTLVARLPDGPGRADVAVSRATFLGLSMRPALTASVVVLITAALIGAAAALLRRRRPPANADDPAAREPMGWIGMAAGLAVIGVLAAPGIAVKAAAIATNVFTPGWDNDNLMYWDYLAHHGWLPYRTFWYPYGGFFAFELPLPIGPAIRWLFGLGLYGTFFVAVGRWRGAGVAILATAVTYVAMRFDLVPSVDRYLLAVNVLLAYVAIGRDGGARARIPFWVACAMAMLAEPVQLLYAGLPVGLILATDVLETGGRGLLRRLRLDFGVPAGLAVTYGAVLAASGQLRGFGTFYGRLGDSVAYSAWPAGLPTLRLLPQDQQSFIVLSLLAALVAVGTCEWIAGGTSRRYGQAVAGLAMIQLMVMQKSFVRWIGDQLLVAVCVATVVLALGWPGRRRIADYAAAGLMLGALGATVVVRPAAWAVAVDVSRSGVRALSDAGILLAGSPAVTHANEARFAPERFAAYHAQRQIVERLRAHAGPGRAVRVFTVTDDPALYVMTGQPPVWLANLYNTSPVYEQVRMVRWLRDEDPPYAVLNRDRWGWDEFQFVVRNPLVFAEVVDRYVPFDALGRIDLLRRRGAAEAVPLAYWREALGADVNVGRLASVSSFERAPSCERACADLLEVQVRGHGDGPVRVPLNVGDASFSLTFTRVRNEAVYRVLLDRVWFWRAAQRSNLPRRLGDPIPDGLQLRIRHVPVNDRVLY